MEKGYYQHYKGGIYQVINTAQHTETMEEMVVYKDAKGQIWVRPSSMWSENVSGKPRFQLLRKRDGEIRFAIMQNYYLKYKK